MRRIRSVRKRIVGIGFEFENILNGLNVLNYLNVSVLLANDLVRPCQHVGRNRESDLLPVSPLALNLTLEATGSYIIRDESGRVKGPEK